MAGGPPIWRNTTHDWAKTVDVAHLLDVLCRADEFAPTGTVHLILEVMAYVADEAEESGQRGCLVMVGRDRSIWVCDRGRGTGTRRAPDGSPVRKPVVSTPDLRFWGAENPPLLPDGYPRRGLSVVAALSARLRHHNRGSGGAWRQEYRYGVPVTGLEPADDYGTWGTTITFWPGPEVHPGVGDLPEDLTILLEWPGLEVTLLDLRAFS